MTETSNCVVEYIRWRDGLLRGDKVYMNILNVR